METDREALIGRISINRHFNRDLDLFVYPSSDHIMFLLCTLVLIISPVYECITVREIKVQFSQITSYDLKWLNKQAKVKRSILGRLDELNSEIKRPV